MEEPRSQDQQLLDSFEIHLYLTSSLLIQLLFSNEAKKTQQKNMILFHPRPFEFKTTKLTQNYNLICHTFTSNYAIHVNVNIEYNHSTKAV